MCAIKKFSEIVEEFETLNAKNRYKVFIEKLLEYIEKKYDSGEEGEKSTKKQLVGKFRKDYYEILGNVSEIIGEKHNQESMRRDIGRWFNDGNYKAIKRSSIINIGFVITDELEGNREKVVNELLNAMGYPKLHGTSEIERFYIHALNKKISYANCVKLYMDYKEYIGHKIPFVKENEPKGRTSTYYHDYVIEIQEKEGNDFFDKMWEISSEVSAVSRIMSDLFCDSFNNAINAYGTEECVKLAFYMLFSDTWLRSRDEILDDLGKYKEENKYGEEWEKNRKEMWDEFLSPNNKFQFKVIKGYRKNGEKEERGSRFGTVYTDINKVLKREADISREALLLWLIFQDEKDYESINNKIKKRYATLDKDVYFDRFIMLVSNFQLEEGSKQIKYFDFNNQQEYLVEDDEHILSTDDLHSLRRSVIIYLNEMFDLKMAAGSFINTENNTSKNIIEIKRTQK